MSPLSLLALPRWCPGVRPLALRCAIAHTTAHTTTASRRLLPRFLTTTPRRLAPPSPKSDPNSSEHSHSSQPNMSQATHSHEASLEHSHSHEGHDQNLHDSHSHSHEHEHDHSHSLFSHSHSHQHNELLTGGFWTNPAVRITWVGLAVNVAMAGTKAVGGVYFHSQALIADAIHSVSDMVADFLTLATVNVALREGSVDKFPLGYGKLESLGTLFVSGVLLFAGFTVGWLSLLQIFEFVLPTHVYELLLAFQVHSHSHFGVESHDAHSHSHAPADAAATIPNINAAWLALGSIGIKEVLYRKTMTVAAQTNSKVLVANAWHHRVDSLTAGVAFLTVMGGVLFGVLWLDAAGGLLVSLLIINAGSSTFKEAWYELIDRGNQPASEHYQNVKLMLEQEVATVSKTLDTDFAVADVSVLSAGARTNLIVKLNTTQNVSLELVNELEHELIAGLREKDRFIGKVFVEYALKRDAKLG